jgi:REP element-mobilizing transposase RayT
MFLNARELVTYLITFATYGSHLHGDERGSVDRRHNVVGSPILDFNPKRASAESQLMKQPAYKLDKTSRVEVMKGIEEVCSHRGWTLLAAHVRSNHLHVVVEAEAQPEAVMNALKAYASRRLNRRNPNQRDQKRWARHGSTRWLWTRDDVCAAINYVIEEQGGEPMEVFLDTAAR